MEVTRQMCADLLTKTGLRPTNHVLLVQEEVAAKYPGLPMLLYSAMEKSKQEAYARARKSSASVLIFPELDFADNARRFGEDPYPPGLKADRKRMEAVRDELLLEQLTRKKIEVESLLVTSTLHT